MVDFSTAGDWDNAVDESGVAHETVTNTDNTDDSSVKQGYTFTNYQVIPEPIAHYPLQEDSGSTAYDVRGANDGTVNGATQGVEGLLGTTAYSFDGSNDYIDLVNFSNSVEFSVCAWVKPNSPTESVSPNEQMIATMGDDGDGSKDRWMLIARDSNTDGTFGFSFFRDMQDVSGGVLSSHNTGEKFAGNEWHHVVGTFGSNGLKLYIDGRVEASDTNTDNVNSFRHKVVVGRNEHADAYIDGTIADVRVYDHALSASEVQYLYQVPTGQSSLTTEWKQS